MSIILDIKPEVHAELNRQVAAHGRAVESYAASLLEEAIQLPLPESAAALPAAPAKDNVELFAPLRGLSLDFGRNPSTGRPIDL